MFMMAKIELPAMSSLFLLVIQFYFILLSDARNETDRVSLVALKARISADPFGTLSSWNESLHFCEWYGVTCGRLHRRVVELDLHSSQLVGSLSPHVGNLTFLRILNLRNNSLRDNIPQDIGRLFRLQELHLANNSLGGEIPANLSHCSNLQSLSFGGNEIIGKLPAEFGSLSKLREFAFQVNNLVGEIPPSFGNLSSIERLYGSRNNLQGSIPYTIGQLKSLKHFALGLNNLSGKIPHSIYNLSFLTIFSVPVNQLHGSLPSDLGLTLPNIEILQLHTNQFSGQLPVSIFNSSNLSDLQLSKNSFTGKVPSLASLPNLKNLIIGNNYLGNDEEDDLDFLYSLANNTNLEVLTIHNNNLGGVLPEAVSNFSTKLRVMVIAENQIRGRIPDDIGNLISLIAFGWEMNRLTGIIPDSIGKLQNLDGLYLTQNMISGSIPVSLGNITSLTELFLGDNSLQGSIPSSLGNCRNLLSLVLSQNNLSGPIPREVVSISSLSLLLDLSENQLMGLPSEVGRLVNLGSLDLSKNKLSGEIPGSLGSCKILENLNLEGNFFQGQIPESLSSLRALEDFNLSYNNLTGQIPKFLSELTLLQNLDLSFNDLGGEVPLSGVFDNTSAFSILGNKKVCGGVSQLNLSKCISNKSRKPKISSKPILIVIIACGFIGVILVASVMLCYCLKKKRHELGSESSWEASFQRVAYGDLLQATDEFSSSNLIGAGSFGSVYRGILPPDGVTVAIKVFNMLHEGASKSFMAECAALMNIRHRNLVKVLTACSTIDFQGNEFKALIYEFMVNGSLEEWLHPVHTSDKGHGSRKLTIIQRLNIAIDVVHALEYLHHHCEIPIVHCDLKPSNVLLDGDMTAYVGDFGLARFRPESFNRLSSNQTSSVGLKGTIGYAPPEYGMGSDVSTYGDVYSYGILLLEMFTGRRPTDNIFKEELNLHNFCKIALPDRVAGVLDPILLREAEETSADASQPTNLLGTDKILGCLSMIIKVGIACSAELPRERMDVRNVATELNRIMETILGTKMHI